MVLANVPMPAVPAIQSALEPHGVEAAGLAQMSWWLFGGAVVVFALVAAAAVAALRAPRPWMARERFIVAAGIVMPVVVLTALLVYTLIAAPRVALAARADVNVEVVARQWWWDVRYLRPDGATDFATANEIRVPVGATVEVRLRSADVLHSFWVPPLAGKLDAIPGRENRMRLVATHTGTFRGQCAEYCGGPHGQMALVVVAQPAAQFDAWLASQRRKAVPSGVPGEALFLANCASCHTVRGTPAAGTLGPDLTHFASRVALGAGILPNEPAAVARWIAGNQHLKPGNLMPEFPLGEERVAALAAYLAALE
jgi:cytochrome c oxidase subunit 2